MIWALESVLIGRDKKGNPVAMWAKHPVNKMDLMYLTKQVKLTDVEKFSNDMYMNNAAESLSLKAGVNNKDETIIQD